MFVYQRVTELYPTHLGCTSYAYDNHFPGCTSAHGRNLNIPLHPHKLLINVNDHHQAIQLSPSLPYLWCLKPPPTDTRCYFLTPIALPQELSIIVIKYLKDISWYILNSDHKIPNRLSHAEPQDCFRWASPALRRLIKGGLVVSRSQLLCVTCERMDKVANTRPGELVPILVLLNLLL